METGSSALGNKQQSCPHAACTDIAALGNKTISLSQNTHLMCVMSKRYCIIHCDQVIMTT